MILIIIEISKQRSLLNSDQWGVLKSMNYYEMNMYMKLYCSSISLSNIFKMLKSSLKQKHKMSNKKIKRAANSKITVSEMSSSTRRNVWPNVLVIPVLFETQLLLGTQTVQDGNAYLKLYLHWRTLIFWQNLDCSLVSQFQGSLIKVFQLLRRGNSKHNLLWKYEYLISIIYLTNS